MARLRSADPPFANAGDEPGRLVIAIGATLNCTRRRRLVLEIREARPF